MRWGTRHRTATPHPPSPGAPRPPLPARERRLFVAALETVRTLFFTLQAEQTPLRPLGGRRGPECRTSPHDTTDPHPALCAGLSLPGRGRRAAPGEGGRGVAVRSRSPHLTLTLSAPQGGGEGSARFRERTESCGLFPTKQRRNASPSPGRGRRTAPGEGRWYRGAMFDPLPHLSSSPSPWPGRGRGVDTLALYHF